MRRWGVFLDRDGVINEEIGYLGRAEFLKLLPGVAKAIQHLNQMNIPTIVVTNQAGVARGYFPVERVDEIHRALSNLLATEGAHVDRYYVCPHHPTEGIGSYRVICECRKPKPGMLYHAAHDLGLDLGRCFMVGDTIGDIQAGISAGCQTVLVLSGYGKIHQAQLGASRITVDFIAADLSRAVTWILGTLGSDIRM